MPMSRKDKALYRKHLKDLKEKDPEITMILGATLEEEDWIKKPGKGTETPPEGAA